MESQHLDNPNKEVLQQHYRQLKRFECLTIHCEEENLNTLLQHCERIGFIALTITLPKLQNKLIEVTCTKAKNGPCYDEGHKATYLGSSIAVLDDDAHLLFPHIQQPICLKTKDIYASSYYTGKVSIKNNPNFKVSEFGPLPFDCDDFEGSIQTLMSAKTIALDSNKEVPIFYPGPFKAIFTQSGYLIRRGLWNNVPKELAQLLCQEEGAIQGSQTAEPAPKFKNYINEHGATALLDLPFLPIQKDPSDTIDINALNTISESLKLKILHCIDINSNNIILTGSDPQNEFGCCPSEDVGHANHLVRNGILDKISQDNTNEQCPIQLYTFKNEASLSEESFSYQKNDPLRSLVQQNLEPSLSSKVMRWALIGFIVFSMAFSLFKIIQQEQNTEQKNFQDIVHQHHIQKNGFILFHLDKRCDMCLKMEEFTKEFCKKHKLSFTLINMARPDIKHLIESEQLFTASLYYLKNDINSNFKTTLIKEAWEQWKEKESFTSLLSNTLND